jgi:hypothetical protein
MKIDDWLNCVELAVTQAGHSTDESTRKFLQDPLPETMLPDHKMFFTSTHDAVFRMLFQKALVGGTFGPLERVREQFGQSVEENYGKSIGPFIQLARSYWTFKLEMGDLWEAHRETALYKILHKIEFDVAAAFFPSSQNASKMSQKTLFSRYCPEMDVEAFFADNPYFGAGGSGCLGVVIAVTAAAGSAVVAIASQ